MGRKRNRNRRPATRNLECTCSLRHELDTDPFEDHSGGCALWHSEDFMNGLSEWCPLSQKLVSRWPDEAFEDELWSGDVPVGAPSDMQKIIDATVGGMAALPGKGKWGAGYVSCRHNLTEVTLPDEAGTVVYCSGSMDARGNRPFRPDWSVYLCHSWTARGSLALFIPWQDYGTPWVDWAQVRWAAQDAYARALAGQRVEIGCMGGHGRTGTFLACLAQLADPNMSAQGSSSWVKANYCSKAIEDESQHYFLDWFADPSLAPVWVDPNPPKKIVTTVIGPKSGADCNWSQSGVPCALPLGHPAPHLYTRMKAADKVTVGAAVARLKAAKEAKAAASQSPGGITLAQAIEQAKRV